jgi:hypothetical protein
LVETVSRNAEREVRGMLEALASLGSEPDALPRGAGSVAVALGAMLVDRTDRSKTSGCRAVSTFTR